MGLVKVPSLINNYAKHSDTRIDWIVFHNIYEIYRNMKHKYSLQVSLAIKKHKPPCFSSPPHPDQPSELNLPGNLQEVPL